LTVVRVYEDEPFEITLKKFKRKCMRDGIFSELRKRRYYEKPSLKKRKKVEATKRRALKERVFQR
jgi:small subunit ribosomal protein S21